MQVAGQVTVQIRIVSGQELPKTDFFGEMDGSVKLFVDDQEMVTTRVIPKNANPVWEEDCFVDVPYDEDGWLMGVVRAELFAGCRTPEYVGCSELDLSGAQINALQLHKQPAQGEHFECPLMLTEDKRGAKLAKQGRASSLTLALLGAMPTFDSYLELLQPHAEELGLVADPGARCLFVALPGPSGELLDVYAGICWELPRAVRIKLLSASKEYMGLHLDFRHSKERRLTVERVQHPQGRRERVCKGLKAHTELAVIGLPLAIDLRRLHVVAAFKKALASRNVAEVLQAADFPGPSAPFKRAAKETLGGCRVEPATCSLYLPVGKAPHSALLQIAYRDPHGPAGPTELCGGGTPEAGPPRVLVATVKGQDAAAGHGKSLFHTFVTTADTTITRTTMYRKGCRVLGDEFTLSRATELCGAYDDAEKPLANSAALVFYALEDELLLDFRFADLLQPPPEPPPPEPLGLVDAFDPNNVAGSVATAATIVAERGTRLAGALVDSTKEAVGTLVSRLTIHTDGTPGNGVGAKMLKVFQRGGRNANTDITPQPSLEEVDEIEEDVTPRYAAQAPPPARRRPGSAAAPDSSVHSHHSQKAIGAVAPARVETRGSSSSGRA